ncbi:MAG: hypothetical protein IK142_03390, partial [Clostridiales bacterium]|nr:hypothetical protein [Clostridiales bacterium]
MTLSLLLSLQEIQRSLIISFSLFFSFLFFTQKPPGENSPDGVNDYFKKAALSRCLLACLLAC